MVIKLLEKRQVRSHPKSERWSSKTNSARDDSDWFIAPVATVVEVAGGSSLPDCFSNEGPNKTLILYERS